MNTANDRPLRIGIACYPLIGGSGILASALGTELAQLGHEVHFFAYERPVRLDLDHPNLRFHKVEVGDYSLFRYPDYSLPLAVKMAEVAESRQLDIIHAHYAVPHAMAAYLAKRMAKTDRLRIVTTLHGTDTTLLGRDPKYRPAIEYALQHSDVVTTVSQSLKAESERLFQLPRPIRVVYNFFTPGPATMEREEMRAKLGLGDAFTLLHASNLRPVKRVDLLLRALSALPAEANVKLLLVAGSSFDDFWPMVDELGVRERIALVGNEYPIENYIAASDVGIYTSEQESFCLSILESMFLGKPSLAFGVGGVPEVIEHGVSGLLHGFGDVVGMASSIQQLAADPAWVEAMGVAAAERARRLFTAGRVVPQYLDCYREAMERA